MQEKFRDWLIAIGYVVLIYATLEVARLPLSFLRSHGLLKITLGILFFAAALLVIVSVLQQKPFYLWKFPFLFLIGLAYFFIAKHVKTPEEQIHFLEYGLVGIFFLRAWSHHFDSKPISWMLALAFSCLAGWIDELLQGLSPHRHYDIRDVALNAISATLGLALFFICKKTKSPL